MNYKINFLNLGGLIAKENYYMGKDSAGLDSDNPYTLVKKHYEECVNSEKFWEVEKECSNKEQEEYCNIYNMNILK